MKLTGNLYYNNPDSEWKGCYGISTFLQKKQNNLVEFKIDMLGDSKSLESGIQLNFLSVTCKFQFFAVWKWTYQFKTYTGSSSKSWVKRKCKWKINIQIPPDYLNLHEIKIWITLWKWKKLTFNIFPHQKVRKLFQVDDNSRKSNNISDEIENKRFKERAYWLRSRYVQ